MGELKNLSAKADEWDALTPQHGRLSNAQALLDAAQGALQILDDDDGGTAGKLHNACQLLQQQEQLEPSFKGPTEILSSTLAQVQDTVHSLRAYLRRTEPDPQRLSELDARMALWLSLTRRYKRAPPELPQLLTSWQQELEKLDAAADLGLLETAQSLARDAYMP